MIFEERLSSSHLRLIAFHLPQFHPIPENDKWWGRDFTEWTNVRRATPLFPGHQQPRKPSPEIGYYNLLDPGVLHRQVELARSYGIHGFCFYHYWFSGKLLLEQPLHLWLQQRELDFPFCLAWANEPWTRKWDGGDNVILQAQDYGSVDTWRKHFRYLLPALEDPRAISIAGRPVLLIYRIGHIPEPEAMINCWREEAEKTGLPGLFLVAMLNGFPESIIEGIKHVDGVCEFAPFFMYEHRKRKNITASYDAAWRRILKGDQVHPCQFKGAFVSWDNTPRRGPKGRVFWKSTPEKYEKYLETQILRVLQQPRDHRLLFINAWNEWGEGCYLEPDELYGFSYLEATREALNRALNGFHARS